MNSESKLPVQPIEDDEPQEVRVLDLFGLLPSPEDLARIEHLMPGATERILKQVEREQIHRHKVELQEVQDQTAHNRSTWALIRRAQTCALLALTLTLAMALAALWLAPNAAGATVAALIGGAGVVGILKVFLPQHAARD